MKLKTLLKFLVLTIFCFSLCSPDIVLSAEQKNQPSPNISNQPSTQTSPTKPPSIPTPQRKPEDTNINVQDIPNIKLFRIFVDARFSAGNQVLAYQIIPISLVWQVESGVGGSSVSSILIEKLEGPGPEVNFRTSDLRGSRALNYDSPLSPGKTIYKITVTNQIGRSASSTAFLEVFSFRQATENVQITNIEMPETEMGKPFDLSLTFSNTNKFPISFWIVIYAVDDHISTPIVMRNSENPHGNWTTYINPLSSKKINIPCVLPLRHGGIYPKKIKIVLNIGGEMASYDRWEYPLTSEIKRVFRLTR